MKHFAVSIAAVIAILGTTSGTPASAVQNPDTQSSAATTLEPDRTFLCRIFNACR